MALRIAKANEDAIQPVWGQRFGAAAELPLGAELYAGAGSTSDLVAGAHTNRVFNRAFPAKRIIAHAARREAEARLRGRLEFSLPSSGPHRLEAQDIALSRR